MPTLQQLPQALIVDAEDEVLLAQDGETKVLAVGTLLSGTQPLLTLAPNQLLGRAGYFPGGPEPIQVGGGLVLETGTLTADGAAVAFLDSPEFTGYPTAPTQPDGDSSDALATTAFVQANLPRVVIEGDLVGAGSGTVTVTLPPLVTPGTYTGVTVNTKGLVTGGTTLTAGDIDTALGYVPYNAANPAGYTTASALDTYPALAYGAFFDGVHDDAPGINAAIAAAHAAGGGTVLLPAGRGLLGSTLLQQWNNIHIVGAGVANIAHNTQPSYDIGTVLSWAGAAGGTMAVIAPPQNLVNGRSISNADVRGVVFDCASSAAVGLVIGSVNYSKFDVGYYQPLVCGLKVTTVLLQAQTSATAPTYEVNDSQHNSFNIAGFAVFYGATTLAAAVPGATTIPVASVANFVVGQQVRIGGGLYLIAAIGTNTLTLATPLATGDSASGTAVGCAPRGVWLQGLTTADLPPGYHGAGGSSYPQVWNGNVSLNRFEKVVLIHYNSGFAFTFGYSDHNYVDMLNAYTLSIGTGVIFDGSNGLGEQSDSNQVNYCSGGQIVARGLTTYPNPSGNAATNGLYVSSNSYVGVVDTGNGTQNPIVEPGATITWNTDADVHFGARLVTPTVFEAAWEPGNGTFVKDPNTSLTVVNNSSDHLRLCNGVGTQSWSLNIANAAGDLRIYPNGASVNATMMLGAGASQVAVQSALSVTGSASISGALSASAATLAGTLAVSGAASIAGAMSMNAATMTTAAIGTATMTSAAVGAATMTTASIGAATVSGAMSAASASVTGAATVGTLSVGNALSVGGATTLAGALTAGGATLSGAMSAASASVTGAATVGTLSVGNALSVGGATTLAGALTAGGATLSGAMSAASASVTGAATVGTLSVGNALSVGGSASVTGALTGSTATLSGRMQAATASVTGAATVGTLSVGNALSVGGAASVVGALTASAATLSGAMSAGSASLSGALTAASATISGGVGAGSLTISGAASVAGSLAAPTPAANDSSGNVATTSWIVAKAYLPQIATLVALRATSTAGFADGRTVLLDAYATRGDGGGGLFTWNAASTATDNGGTVVQPTGLVGAGRWVRQLPDGRVTPQMFGALGDGVTNDTAAFAAALATGPVIVPSATYRIANLVIPNGAWMEGGAGLGYSGDVGTTPGTGQKAAVVTPILLAVAGTTSCILNVYGSNDATLKGLFLDGGANTPTCDGVSSGSTQIMMERVTVVRCINGLGSVTNTDLYTHVATLINCEFANNTNGISNPIDTAMIGGAVSANTIGVNLGSGANANSFIAVRFEWSINDGVAGYNASSNVFCGGLFDRNAWRGANLGAGCKDWTFVGVQFARNGSNNTYPNNSHIALNGTTSVFFNGCVSRTGTNDDGTGTLSPAYFVNYINTNALVTISGCDVSGFVTGFAFGSNPTSYVQRDNFGAGDTLVNAARPYTSGGVVSQTPFTKAGATIAPGASTTIAMGQSPITTNYSNTTRTLHVTAVNNNSPYQSCSARIALGFYRDTAIHTPSGSAAYGETGGTGVITWGGSGKLQLSASSVASDGSSFTLGILNGGAADGSNWSVFAELH